jgi:hypothetical protein
MTWTTKVRPHRTAIVDIIVGTTYETQSRLYLGRGGLEFVEVTDTHLPDTMASNPRSPAPQGFPNDTNLVRFESGWFATDGDVWWMHAGDQWISLTELGMERTGDACPIVPRGAGQTTLFFAWSECVPDSSQELPTDLWIISVDP